MKTWSFYWVWGFYDLFNICSNLKLNQNNSQQKQNIQTNKSALLSSQAKEAANGTKLTPAFPVPHHGGPDWAGYPSPDVSSKRPQQSTDRMVRMVLRARVLVKTSLTPFISSTKKFSLAFSKWDQRNHVWPQGLGSAGPGSVDQLSSEAVLNVLTHLDERRCSGRLQTEENDYYVSNEPVSSGVLCSCSRHVLFSLLDVELCSSQEWMVWLLNSA